MLENALFQKASILQHFERLHPETKPEWGLLTAQHMVEHLAVPFRFSNGKQPMELAIPFEKAERAKARVLEPDWRMPREFKAGFMPPEGLPDLQFSSIESATFALFSEIEDFYSFFALNPAATPTHPYFSHLNQQEWEVVHHKHFLHHFEQFGLLK
jgi:hypothetical protein